MIDLITSWKRNLKRVTKGSILRMNLWSIYNGGILWMEIPSDTYLAGYAHDVAAVIVARNKKEAQVSWHYAGFVDGL